MAVCELCGKVVDTTITLNVAGTNMQACSSCKGLGKAVDVAPSGPNSHSFYKRKKEQMVLDVMANYAQLINAAVSKKGLNLHQVARALNIKESTVHKYSAGKLKPDVDSARKIQHFLEIKLLEEKEEVDTKDFMGDDSNAPLSLGEMLKKEMEKNK